jgi:long-chain acyl-CoA synthetase
MPLSQPLSTLWDILAGLIDDHLNTNIVYHWDSDQTLTGCPSHNFAKRCIQQASSLKSLIEPGECIGLLGKPGPEWMISDFSILGAGGVTVPLFPGTAPDILAYQLKKAKISKLFLLHEDALVDRKPLSSLNIFTPCKISADTFTVTLIDSLSPNSIENNDLKSLWASLNKELQPEKLATIIFTSGSTGQPKGVPLNHRNLVSQILGAHERFPLDPHTDRALSFLPLAHIFERMVTYYYLSRGIPIYYCEQVQKLGQRLREVQPTVMTSVPRLLEKVQSAMSAEISKKSSPQKEIGRWALSTALTHPSHLPHPILSWFAADHLVYSKLRESLGGKLNMLIVGGAALSPRLARFFNNIGIPTYQGYGMTETSPVIAANCPGQNKVGSVGCAFPQVEIKIDPLSGEICVKGPGTMEGYLESHECIIDAEGYLHTGDLGELDESGYLTITGRKKELMKTSNGKYVGPVPIESALCAHPWIDQAMLVAEGKHYVCALLVADENNCPEELKIIIHQTEHPETNTCCAEIQQHIEQINSTLNPWEKIQKYRWIPQPLTVETGELTPTMKIRRHIVEKKYGYLIEHMYNTTS